MSEVRVGVVFKFFAKPMVAALELEDSLRVGDRIHFLGQTTDFAQSVESMQVEMNSVEEAGGGDNVGVKVNARVRPGDRVYKVVSE
ncbi:MAG TPA: translation elongation factor-like protein [Candidatus Altiarchaeales archaeon]|nr:translation elongation factor-like protein [Candidatus Altiarchaeales archaeon]